MSRKLLCLTGAVLALTSQGALAQTPNFHIGPDAATLPKTGPKAWCNRADVRENMLIGLSGLASLKASGERITGFEKVETKLVDGPTKRFSCYIITVVSNGQRIAGTFRSENNAEGQTKWYWDNDEKNSRESESKLSIPPDQDAFVQAAVVGKTQYALAETEFAKGASRPRRKAELCKIIKSPNIKNWFGRLAKLSTNSDGDGVIAIEVWPGVQLKTWSNSVSDAASNTMVRPNDPLYQKLLGLKPDSIVKFSGTFFLDPTDCVREASLSLKGSMMSPEFIMKFSSIELLLSP